MLVLVCGDRAWKDKELIWRNLADLKLRYLERLKVIEGGADGADFLAFNACAQLHIPVESIKAEWGKFGKNAGPIRNRKMLDKGPGLVLAFHDDIEDSKGTKDCVTEARKRGIEIWLVTHSGITVTPASRFTGSYT